MQMHATALFADRHSAHAAVEQLAQAGFARDEVTVAMSEDTHEREFGPTSPTRSGIRPSPSAGGVLTAIVSGLAVFATPGSSALRVGGPLLRALLRAGALSVALFALGMGEPEARALRQGLINGSIIVGVQASSERVALAMQLLELSGGEALSNTLSIPASRTA
jgi:hypothetical protein